MAGLVCVSVGAEKKTLSPEMFSKMDANKNGEVSRDEYVEFGASVMKKRGKKPNRMKLGAQFAEYDHNRDEKISPEDATYKSPQELLDSKLQGKWTGKTNKGPISFIFMDDGQADVIKDGESLREKARGAMKYRFVHPKKTPTCIDIVVELGQGKQFYFKCIVEFISDNQMRMRMVTGSEFATRPRSFPEGGSLDMLILNRS